MRKPVFVFLALLLLFAFTSCDSSTPEVETCTVTFDSDGGSAVSSVTVNAGDSITAPQNPTRRGYLFQSWQLDGEDFDFDSVITKNITLKATWKINHKHVWNDGYSSDGTEHWKACSECDDRNDVESHEVAVWIANLSNDTASGTCTICGNEAEKKITSGVVITGVTEFENRLFATAEEAYNTIRAYLEKEENGGLKEEPLSEENFNRVYSEKGKIGWHIYGEQRMDGEKNSYFLSFGREAMHYGTNLHIDNISVTGENETAKLICNDLHFNYEWWDENHSQEMMFKDLALEGIAEKDGNIMPSQAFADGVKITFENCTVKGKLYVYQNHDYTLDVINCEFDSIDPKSYSIHCQGSEKETATINIKNSVFRNSRGINIDQKTAEATITGNVIENCGNRTDSIDNNYYGVLQVTQGANVTIENNTIRDCIGNAFWLYSNNKGVPSFTGKLTITNNTVQNCTYAFCAYGYIGSEYNLTSSGNSITGTNTDKCFVRGYDDDSQTNIFEEADATVKLQ